jgi:hypothetical protein
MSAHSAPRLSRRSFLKYGVTAVAATFGLRLADPERPAPSASSLEVHSALPLPGYEFLPFPEHLLEWPIGHGDVALVPAYVAAQLIQAGRLQPLYGPAGRPHDPDGRYTVPFAYRVAALRFPDATIAPQTTGWVELWSAASRAVWPAYGRLITGAALLRRGFSPNDTHPGHLAQAADDLEQLRPRIVPPVTGRSPALRRTEELLAFVLADPVEVGPVNGLRLPAEGTMLIEYDWVITAGPVQAATARQFIDNLPPAAQPPRTDLPVRLIPLMPLPPAASAQHAAIWASLTARQAVPAA